MWVTKTLNISLLNKTIENNWEDTFYIIQILRNDYVNQIIDQIMHFRNLVIEV